MSTLTVSLMGLGITVFALLGYLLYRRSNRTIVESNKTTAPPAPAVAIASVSREVQRSPQLPSAIIFGSNVKSPAVTLKPVPLAQIDSFHSTPVIEPSIGIASRLTALMQAAPSLLVADAHNGRKLMEVVIDGALVRASDGNGFRAMSMGADGIREQARLFEAGDLTNLVNAAAVWQLASVVVAQKHLADISEKLTEIKEAVTSISDFLDAERRSVIQGTYQYLSQACEVLTQGELSPAIRLELESCERELLAVQNHLFSECQTRARVIPKDEDTFGTESLHKNSVQKYSKLREVIGDLDLCVKTRALSWYVLSLYPGEQALKTVRRKNIEESLLDLDPLKQLIDTEHKKDVEKFEAFWNSDKTLAQRKSDVSKSAMKAHDRLAKTGAEANSQLTQTEALLLERDSPTQLIVELMDGQIKGIRQRNLVAA